MRYRRIPVLVVISLLLGLLAACGADNSGSREPTAPAAAPANQDTAQTGPERPTAPASSDSDFRSDPGSVVAATGRPQLLEFFTFW